MYFSRRQFVQLLGIAGTNLPPGVKLSPWDPSKGDPPADALAGADAVVFVADSQASRLEANAESLRGLRQELLLNGIDPGIPLVVQYNKRDLPDALPLDELEARLNPLRLPRYEAVATQGLGVNVSEVGVDECDGVRPGLEAAKLGMMAISAAPSWS